MRAGLGRGMQGDARWRPGAGAGIPRNDVRWQENLSDADREYIYGIDAPGTAIWTGSRRAKARPPAGGIFRGTILGLGGMVALPTGAVAANLQRITGWIDPEGPHRKGPPAGGAQGRLGRIASYPASPAAAVTRRAPPGAPPARAAPAPGRRRDRPWCPPLSPRSPFFFPPP